MRKILTSLLIIAYTINIAVFANTGENMLKNTNNELSRSIKNLQRTSDEKSSLIPKPGLLSDSILSSLIKMKNEEKLAHDVYLTLYKKWGSMPFSNISSAEERHLNAVIALLKNYGSADTLIGDVGKFTSPEVQKLYNDLIIKGKNNDYEH